MENINQYFEGVAWKYLSAVDADPRRSNQHELGGLVKAGFKKYLGDPGTDTHTFATSYIFLAEDEDDCVAATGNSSWYDARRNQTNRGPELRLYYEANPVTEQLSAGMFFLVAKLRNDELLLVFTHRDSSAEQQLRWLFGIKYSGDEFQGLELDKPHERRSWASIWILEKLGIELKPADDDWLEHLISRFGERFPPTRQFSDFARESLTDLETIVNPDEALLQMTATEERFFRLLERHIVQKRIDKGFIDVDDFVSYSLSVHNTRKSRAGHSFENHLEFIFRANGLKFERGAYTEARSKPDFLFPGSHEYRNQNFPKNMLTMLGVKTSCKDRWRQVLREAKRISDKHLATLEPAISENQTNEMIECRLQLVVPLSLHETYSERQRDWLWSIVQFIEFRKQAERSRKSV